MAGQNLTAGLKAVLEQQQHLSMDMQRSLELLTLPLPELQSRLTAELAVNPMLEELTPENFSEAPENHAPETEDENDYESSSSLPDEWSDTLPLPQEYDPDAAKQNFFANIPAPPPELRSMLLAELALLPLSPRQLYLAAEIVTALNDDGYLPIPLPDLAMFCDAEMDEISDALHIVQEIAPAGIAARDPAECLKLQLIREKRLTPALEKLLDEGLEDLEKNRLHSLEKKLNITSDELQKMLKILRSLNPAPGRVHSSGAAVIIPDLEIATDADGNYLSIPQKGSSVQIILSPIYEKLLQKKDLPEDDRKYLNEKLERAKEFLRALSMRESTLKRLGDLLISNQTAFLEQGAKALKSMTMKSAANALDLSESTISRTVTGKFVQTPQGVFPLKFFFSAGYTDADGNDLSSRAILEKIRSLIDMENPAAPLSDDAIAGELKKSGISVARRTIAKYRDILKIPSSSRRKKLF